MAQVHVIRDKVLREGISQRRVAREMGISRNTVKKYMEVSEPKRVVMQPRRRPVLERVERRLGELVSEWSERTTRKQRLTGTRLHRELVEEGYAVGVTLVRSYLREWHRRRSEVYIPLVHRVGDEAQVDFFEVTVEVAGQRRKAWQFLVRLMYSLLRRLRPCRRPGPQPPGSPGRANPHQVAPALPADGAADRRRTGVRSLRPRRRRAALQPALRPL